MLRYSVPARTILAPYKRAVILSSRIFFFCIDCAEEKRGSHLATNQSDNTLNNVNTQLANADQTTTWRVFRIMSEFVEGFTFLAHIHKNVTIFGSARLPETHPYYQQARTLARKLAERGFTIVTGGGPGIMQ